MRLPSDYTEHLIPVDDNRGHLMLGRVLLAVIIAVLAFVLFIFATFLFIQPAHAEGRDWSKNSSKSVSSAESNVSVNTGAAAYGGGASSSITEQRQAPGLGSLALGGGNPCAYAPATAQFSIVGGGAGIGGMKIDEACALIVLGAASNDARAYKAAGLVIAGRSPAACKAMEQAGMVDCVTAEDRKLAKTSTAASSKSGGNGKCVLTGKKLSFRVSSGGDRDAELSACKAKYGL